MHAKQRRITLPVQLVLLLLLATKIEKHGQFYSLRQAKDVLTRYSVIPHRKYLPKHWWPPMTQITLPGREFPSKEHEFEGLCYLRMISSSEAVAWRIQYYFRY